MSTLSTTTTAKVKSDENDSTSMKRDVAADKSGNSLVLDFDLRQIVPSSRKKDNANQIQEVSTSDMEGAISYGYDRLVESFSSTMCFLVEYIHQASERANTSFQTNFAEMYRILIDMVYAAKQSKRKATEEVILTFSNNKSSKPIVIAVPVVDDEHLNSLRKYSTAAVAAPRILAASMIQEIVNAWEYLLGSLIGTRMDTNMLKDNQSVHVSYSELSNLEHVYEVKRLFIDKIVREFLRKNIDEQLTTLDKEYKVDVSSSLEKKLLIDLKETIVRRHAIVHCNSIATFEYCNRVKQLGLSPPDVGQELVSSTEYLLHAWDVFFAAGMIVANKFRVSHARQLKSEEMEAQAFRDLVTTSHKALKHGRNEAACFMLRYANQLSIKDNWACLATKINLALAYKRMGENKECAKVLDGYDWSYSGDDFKASEAALRGKTKAALKIICKICRKNHDFIKSAHDWVVFEDVRCDGEFDKAMQQLASKRGRKMVKVAAPAVHFSKETDANDMLRKLFDVATKFSQNQPS